jgi:hypothetical protein
VTPNWMGLIAAAATFFGIWVGHVSVRKIEAASASLWPPTLIALALGLALEIGALLSPSPYLSGALGIVGMTVLFDAFEFTRQHRRVKHGHAAANPSNPRHARLLAESPTATTIDWLDREPAGHPLRSGGRETLP